MKNARISLIVFVILALGATAGGFFMAKQQNRQEPAPQDMASATQETQEQATPAAPPVPPLMVGDTPVDPLCFVNPSAESMPQSYPVANCGNGAIVENPEGEKNPMGDQFIGKSYQSTSDNTIRGAIGYRYVGEVDGHKAVWVVENTGGTGIFTSLLLLDQDGATNALNVYKNLAAGDRCNGGIAAADIVEGKLVYERDLTPYDILGLTGDPAREILRSEPAKKLPVCSICCYGRAQYEGDALKGVQFDLRLPQAIASKNYSEGAEPEKCFDELVKLNVESGKGYFDIPALESFTAEIEHVCLGRPESE